MKFLNFFGRNISPTNSADIQRRPHVTLAVTHPEAVQDEGRLESDAVPVDDDGQTRTANSTPTASDDITANLVRELADPNYNSMPEMAPAEDSGAVFAMSNESTTNNNMNVHNAQQQVVMQFSHVNQLHFGSVYNFNSDLSGRQKSACAEVPTAVDGGVVGSAGESKRQTPRKTTSVVAMMQSQQEPDHRMMEVIATHLGDGWKLVMRNLGHSEGQIEQAMIDHQMHGGIKEVIYQLLLQWVRNAEDGEATTARITSLLWESNHRECVQHMKLVFKSNAKQRSSS